MKTSFGLKVICLWWMIFSTWVAQAAVKLPSVFGDHMVLQQNAPVKIWGWADPKEKVTVELAGQKVIVKADEKGNWKAMLKSLSGGPYVLKVQASNLIEIQDVLMGELWLSSGQSNMEWPLTLSENGPEEASTAHFPEIRYFVVPRNIQFKPEENFTGGQWKKVSPETAGELSAVAYYFAKSLHQRHRFPVGIIGSYWGGTDVETWMSATSMRDFSKYDASMTSLKTFDEKGYREIIQKRREELRSFIVTEKDGLQDGVAHWAKPDWDDRRWSVMTLPCLWETSLLPDVDGIVWFRKKVSLTKAQAEQVSVLFAGQIDDSDICWINGQKVGQTNQQYNAQRAYKINRGVLKEGENVITIRVEDTGGGGGVWGEKENLRLDVGAERISLAGDWKFQVSPQDFRTAPSAFNPNQFPTLLYNGMIHPLRNLSLQGMIWYQGENNVNDATGYAKLFPAMIQDWRTTFGDPDLEFFFVQLASFMPYKKVPEKSQWAELRAAQLAALGLPKTAVVTAIDLGDSKDIHPRNKRDVGNRLALPASAIVYKDTVEYRGPVFEKAERNGNKVSLRFQFAKGLYCTSVYGYVQGFQLAGKDGVFYWAQANIVNGSVEVTCDKVAIPVALRYAWADNAGDANLYNGSGLPALPFECEVK